MNVLIVGGSRADRLRAASAWEHSGSFRPSSRIVFDAAALPNLPTRAILPAAEPRLLRIDDLEAAFAFDASSSLRLILTQSTYIMQKWIDALSAGDRIVATADMEILTQSAPEALARRGPWRFFSIVEISRPEAIADQPVAITSSAAPSSVSSVSPVVELLRQATRCRDQGDVSGARQALDQALQLAPDWEAVHYESGKFWLACDDMERGLPLS